LLAEQVDNSKAGGFEADNTAIALELEAVKAAVPVRKLLFWFMSFSGKTKDPSNSAHDLIWPLTTSAANKKGKDMPGGLTVQSLLGQVASDEKEGSTVKFWRRMCTPSLQSQQRQRRRQRRL
jgi:hypothetical protein